MQHSQAGVSMDEHADSDDDLSVLSLSVSFSPFKSSENNSENESNSGEELGGIIEPYRFEPLAEMSATNKQN